MARLRCLGDSTVTLASESVKTLASEVGFDLCGIAGVTANRSAVSRFDSWVDRGLCAGMNYLSRNAEHRADLRLSMPEASSVIVLGMSYYCPNNDAIPPGHGRVARYARGRDYHEVLAHKCQCLVDRIQSELNRLGLPPAKSKCWVDSGPVMEKAFADVLETSLKHRVPMRTAAFIVAIQRVAKAAELRGLYA